MTRRLGGLGTVSLRAIGSLWLRLFVVMAMLVMPAALLGCGGDDTGNPVPAMDGSADALADGSTDGSADGARSDASDAGGDATDGRVGDGATEAGPKTLIAVQVTPSGATTIPIGQTQAFVATANFNDGTTQDVSSSATWTSTPTSVATISSSGVATAVAAGNATITASYAYNGGTAKTGSAALIVSPAALSSLAIGPANPTVAAGFTLQLTATAAYADGSTQNVTSATTWNSGTTSVATISTLGMVTGVTSGSSTITATFNGQTATATLTVSSATLTSITVNPPAGATSVGGATVQFTATGAFSDGTSHDISSKVTWTTSDVTVATIDASTGIATPVAVGTVTITATSGSIAGNAGLVVSGATVASITVAPATASIAAGSTKAFTATAQLSDGKTSYDVTSAAQWQSSDTTIATVTGGVATAVKAGTVTITATFSGQKATAALTVTTATLSSITVATNPMPAVTNVGTDVTFTATGVYSDKTSSALTTGVAWSSSDATVATIGATTGVAHPLKAGTVTITATVGTITGSTVLTVGSATVKSIAVSATTLSIANGTSEAFTALATYTDNTQQNVTSLATWTSGTIATATESSSTPGLVTAVGVGTSVITATFGGQSGTATLTVTGATLTSISVAPNPATGHAGGATVTFTATGFYSDGTNQPLSAGVSWTSSDKTKATITSAGIASPLVAGTVTITASSGTISGTASFVIGSGTLQTVTVTPATQSIPALTTLQYKAIAGFTDGSTEDVTSQASWNSSNATVASITNIGLASGLTVGSTNITATFQTVQSNTATLGVTGGVLTGISITPASPTTIAKGTTITFVATGSYNDGTSATITNQVAWAQSTAGILTFNGAIATGNTLGSTNVTASLSGVTSNTAAVVVTGATLASIAVTPSTPGTLHINSTLTFVATGTYSDGTQQTLTTASWNSATPATATIAQTGVATGVAAGTSVITASAPGSGNTTITSPGVTLTVGAATLVSIALNPTLLTTLPVGATQQFTSQGVFSDGSTADVSSQISWSATDNAGVPTTDFTVVNGLVTAVAPTTGLTGGQGLVKATIGTIVGTAPVKVTAATITSIAVTCTSPNTASSSDLSCIPAGVNFQLACKAVGTYTDGNTNDITTAGTTTWASTSTTTAVAAGLNGAVHQSELFTILGAGSTTATASVVTPSGTVTGTSASITVQTETIQTGLTVTGSGANVGQSSQFTAAATYVGTGACTAAKSFDVTSNTNTSWSSSDPSVADTVVAGLAHAAGAGSATIAANFGGQTGSAPFVVSGLCLQSMTIGPVPATLPQSVYQALTVVGTLSDNSPSLLSSSTGPGSTGSWGGAPVVGNGGAGWLLDTSSPFASSTLTFTVPNGCGGTTVTATKAVVVDPTILPTALAISPSTSQSINLGGSVDYGLDATYSGVRFHVAHKATWATVPASSSLAFSNDAMPLLTTLLQHTGTAGAGAYTVTAVYRNLTAYGSLTVNGTASVQSIVISSAGVGSPTLTPLAAGGAPIGLPITFGVLITNTDGTTSNSPIGVTFASSLGGTLGNLGAAGANVATTLAAGTTQVTATVADGLGGTVTSANFQVVVNQAALQSISASPSAPTVPENTNGTIALNGLYSDGSTFDISSLVTSQTSNGSIVSLTGVNTFHSSATTPGSSVLTFLKDGKTVTDTVTVSASQCITGLTITPPSVASLPVGATQAFTATAQFTDGSTADRTSSVTWGPATDATLQNRTGGSFKALAAGPDSVTATLTDGTVCAGGAVGVTTVTASASVTVAAAAVASITVDTVPSGLSTIPKGESRQLKVLATLTDGTSGVDVTGTATFLSAPATIASVTPGPAGGLVKALLPGTAVITVGYAGGITAAPFNIIVQDCGNPTLTIAGQAGNMPILAPAPYTTAYTATAVYPHSACSSGPQTFDATSAATWTSSAPAVASITTVGAPHPGVLSALTIGAADITATWNGTTSSAIHVTPTASITLTSLTISAGASLPNGATEPVTVSAVWSDSGTYPAPPVSPQIVDNTVFTVDASNVLHAVKVGSTSFAVQAAGVTSNTLTVAVTAACIQTIALSTASTTLPVGVPFTVGATCTTSDHQPVAASSCTPQFGITGSNIDNTFFPSFATSGQARIKAIGTGYVTAVLSQANGGCGVSGSSATPLQIIGNAATLSSIVLEDSAHNTAQTTIRINTSESLTSMGHYSDTSQFDLSSVAPLLSDNPTIVTANALPYNISSNSTVTANAISGTADITSSYQGVVSNVLQAIASAAAPVLTSLTITADQNLVGGPATSATYPIGYQLQLHASGVKNDGSPTGDLTTNVTWSLVSPFVTGATFGGAAGLLTTGSVAGAQTVKALDSSTGVFATFVVNTDAGTITAVNITSPTNGPPSTSVAMGATAQYEAQAVIGTHSYWVTTNFTWASSALPAVFTIVSATGSLQAVANTGTTNITATNGLLTAGPLVVTASAATPVSVACSTPGNLTTATVSVGSTLQLHAAVLFTSGPPAVDETFSSATTWVSSDPTKANFFGAPDTGIITAIAAGTVTVLPTYTGTTSPGTACTITIQ